MRPRTKVTVPYNSLICAISPMRERIKCGHELMDAGISRTELYKLYETE